MRVERLVLHFECAEDLREVLAGVESRVNRWQ